MNADLPRQWEALQQLQALYAARVRAANDGYWTDMGARVQLEDCAVPEEQLPDLLITARPGGAQVEGQRHRANEMLVSLEARIPVSRQDAQELAWKAHADLMRATPSRLGRGGLLPALTSLSIESDDIYTRPNGQPYIVVQVVLRAGLVPILMPAGS